MSEARRRPSEAARPFCDGSKDLRAAFDRWEARLTKLGIELSDADRYVVGLIASREVRLEALEREVSREKDSGRRLRLIAAERLAAQDMSKVLDLAERSFGGSVREEDEAVPVQATGTDGANVLAFEPGASHGLGVAAGRIVAVIAKAKRPLTKEQIRRAVPGNRGAFADGLREARQAGAVVRSGLGRKGKPFVYSRGNE